MMLAVKLPRESPPNHSRVAEKGVVFILLWCDRWVTLCNGLGWLLKSALYDVSGVCNATHPPRLIRSHATQPCVCSVKSALQGVYKDASRVDDALVQSICTAAEREGAFRAFVRILTGPPGRAVQVDSIKTRVESAMVSALEAIT